MGGGDGAEFRIVWDDPRRTKSAETAGRRRVRRPFVIGLLGVVALVCASCAGGPQHLATKPVPHKAAPMVRTRPATSTTDPATSTTTTAPAPKTKASTFVPAAQPAPPPTTTTTDPFPPGCVWSDFATKVSTDQSSYAPGQPVQITLEFANAGPACTINATGYACPLVSIDNSAGTLVWTSAAPASTGCPSTFTGPTVLAANWSQSFSFTWAQTSCTPGQAAACPGPQVPPGPYQLTGQDVGGAGQIPAGTPVTVDLTAS
jgi:hypothetical protein